MVHYIESQNRELNWPIEASQLLQICGAVAMCISSHLWRIAINRFSLLVATYFVGTYVLAFSGISLPVVQVGGGLIVIATGWTLLKQRDDEKQDVQKTVKPQDSIRRAFYPLTLPLSEGL